MTSIKGDGEFISIADHSGRSPNFSIFGDIATGNRLSHVTLSFSYSNSESFLKTAVTANGGGVTNSTALLLASSSTASNGTAEIQSKNVIRYIPGHDGYALFTAMFTSPKASSYQRIGPMTTNDGFFIGYSGTSFQVGRRKGGSEYTTSSFNIDALDGTGPSQFKIDTTKINIFRINWGYLGIAPIFYEVYGGYDTGWITFHVDDHTNNDTGTHHNIPYLPIKVEVGNTGNTSNIVLSSGSWSGGSIGSREIQQGNKHYAAENTKTISTLTNIITLKSATTFNSKTNLVRISIDSISVSATNSGTNNTTIKIYSNPTLGGSPSYTDVYASDSIVSYDTAGTTITGGILRSVINLGSDGSHTKNYGYTDLLAIYPGEILTIAAVASGGTSTVSVGVNWSEEF